MGNGRYPFLKVIYISEDMLTLHFRHKLAVLPLPCMNLSQIILHFPQPKHHNQNTVIPINLVLTA